MLAFAGCGNDAAKLRDSASSTALEKDYNPGRLLVFKGPELADAYKKVYNFSR